MRDRAFLLLVCIVWCLVPFPSWGQEAVSPLEQAKAHYAIAEQAFTAGQFDIARIEFEAALGLLPPDGSPKNAEIHSATLFNLALVAEKRKDFVACRRYLLLFRNSTKDPDKDEALTALEARLPPVSEQPAPSPTAAGSPAARHLDARRGVSGRTIVGPSLLLALGGASLLAATVPAAQGAGLSRMVETTPLIPEQLADFNAEGTRLNGTAITLCVVGSALAIGGGVWLGLVYGKQHKTP